MTTKILLSLVLLGNLPIGGIHAAEQSAPVVSINPEATLEVFEAKVSRIFEAFDGSLTPAELRIRLQAVSKDVAYVMEFDDQLFKSDSGYILEKQWRLAIECLALIPRDPQDALNSSDFAAIIKIMGGFIEKIEKNYIPNFVEQPTRRATLTPLGAKTTPEGEIIDPLLRAAHAAEVARINAAIYANDRQRNLRDIVKRSSKFFASRPDVAQILGLKSPLWSEAIIKPVSH